MGTASLPADLAPFASAGLIRLGRDHDGGYLVVPADVHAAECLVGLGISTDWSFEEGFVAMNACPLAAYDASIGVWKFLRHMVFPPRRRGERTTTVEWSEHLVNYLRFFQGKRTHIRKFVAADKASQTIGFDAVANWVGSRRVFLKIDIEGAEYGLLDAIVAMSDQITGLTIEFHDCTHRLDEIRSFVGRFGLALVHVHANNAGRVSDTGIPSLLELTFSTSTPAVGTGLALPHPLDMPNLTGRADYVIRFDPKPAAPHPG